MKTRINLYVDQLKPVKEALPLSISTAIMLVTCLIVVGLSGVFWQLSRLEQDVNTQLDNEIIKTMVQLERKIDQYAALNNIDQLLLEKSKLIKDISQHSSILKEIKQRYQQHNQGFSPIFMALSTIKSKDVWLTGFEVDHASIAIAGGAIRSQDIPRWIDGLKQAEVFVGKDFSALEITREQDYLTFVLNEQLKNIEVSQ